MADLGVHRRLRGQVALTPIVPADRNGSTVAQQQEGVRTARGDLRIVVKDWVRPGGHLPWRPSSGAVFDKGLGVYARIKRPTKRGGQEADVERQAGLFCRPPLPCPPQSDATTAACWLHAILKSAATPQYHDENWPHQLVGWSNLTRSETGRAKTGRNPNSQANLTESLGDPSAG